MNFDAEEMVLLFLNLTSFVAVRLRNVTMHGGGLVWDNSCVHFRLKVGNKWRLFSLSPGFQNLHKPLSCCQTLCM